MALRKLTEAECGDTNPLVRLTSHLTYDHALSETHGQVFPSSSDQLVEQFLQETRTAPQTFQMDGLMREMHEIESQRALLPPIPASAVKEHLNNDEWALQYIENSRQFNENPDFENIWTDSSIIGIDDKNECVWAQDYFNEVEASQHDVENSTRDIVDIMSKNPDFEYSKFMKFMKQVSDGELNLQQESDEAAAWSQEYLASASKKEDISASEAWANEFKVTSGGYDHSIWDQFQDEWKKISDIDTNNLEHPWISEYDHFDPYREYAFSEDNPMSNMENALLRGKELLEDGDLPGAVLCFEAAVQKEPYNAEAWLLLGTTQAENEQDPKAIIALKKCLEIEPTNLKALMALAVCYTNENYYYQACQTLLAWLRENPDYRELVPKDFSISGQVTSLLDQSHHKAIQQLYIKAAQRNPQNIDYEVQCGLGVLFNLSSEFQKAADCFKAALSVKPNDARLWNRLGATLANGSMPEQAVDAYHHALNIVPGFIRARYNVGITCINLNSYKEAAEHFLIALNQQSRGSDNTRTGKQTQMSDTIWSTLRMCLSLMNRTDLKSAVDNKDLKTLNDAFQIHDN